MTFNYYFKKRKERKKNKKNVKYYFKDNGIIL